MKPLGKAIRLGSLIFFAGRACAHAEIVVGDSLDWLVVSHDHVATTKVIRIEVPIPTSSAWMERTIVVQRETSLKGTPPEHSQFSRRVAEREAQLPIGTEFLVFFKDTTQIDYAINLSSPPAKGWHEVALSMDFNVLKTKKVIIDTVQARLAKLEHERPSGFLRLAVPTDKPAYMALWSGSACFLNVPADSEFKTKFMEELRSPDVKSRATAAYWLAKYPGQDVVGALKPLLKDPGTDVMQTFKNNRRQDITIYPVRQAAYKTLTTWGIEVPQPAGYDPDYPSFFLE